MVERLGVMRKGRRERIQKGSHCFFNSSGYDKLELKHQNLVHTRFFFFKCHYVKQNAKICAIGEQNVMKIVVFILGGQRIDQKRKWRGRRERIEKGSRERIEIERKETKDNRVNNLKRRIRNIYTCLCLLFKALRFC